MNGKVIVKFKPDFLFKLSKSDRYLNEMQKSGWKLIDIKFGCLLYFRECKAVEKYYYITQFATSSTNKYSVGSEALSEVFRNSYVDNREFFKTRLIGIRPLNFTIYCFSKEDREKISVVTNLRKNDLRTSVYLFADYFFTNFIYLPVALYFIISKLRQR